MNNNYSIVIVGVGGQGILTAAELIGIAGIYENKKVISSEVHGMAQRGGVVVCEVKIGGAKSPLIAKGQADAILGFEPAETYRFLEKGNKKTTVVTAINPIVPFTVSIGASQYPKVKEILAGIKKCAKKLVAVDAFSLAQEAGSILCGNVVMLGALCALPGFPLQKTSMMHAIRHKINPRFADMNIKAFELGYENKKNTVGAVN